MDKGLDATQALQAGMDEKSAQFRTKGARVYLPVTELDQADASTRPPSR